MKESAQSVSSCCRLTVWASMAYFALSPVTLEPPESNAIARVEGL